MDFTKSEYKLEDGEKYVTFPLGKVVDLSHSMFADYTVTQLRQEGFLYVTRQPIPDAVVIRKQDKFAAAALWSYSNIVLTVRDILDSLGIPTDTKELEQIADYFASAAEESAKLTDTKLPTL